MTDVKENPERIWAYSWIGKEGYQGQWDYIDTSHYYGNVTEYVQANLYDALVKERDELAAELTAFENEVHKREEDFAFKMGKLEARAEQAEALVKERNEAEANLLHYRAKWLAQFKRANKAEAEVERLRGKEGDE